MKHNASHINYTASDIQRYIEGKMLPAEMHLLEKAALDDPFLSEAIEGYQALPAHDWNTVLADLTRDFAAQLKAPAPAPVVRLQRRYGWVRYAAAVLVLGGGIALAYWFYRPQPGNGESPSVAAAETKPTSAAPSIQSMPDSTAATTLAPTNPHTDTVDKPNTLYATGDLPPNQLTQAPIGFGDQLQKADSNTLAFNTAPNVVPLNEFKQPTATQNRAERKDDQFDLSKATAPTAPAARPTWDDAEGKKELERNGNEIALQNYNARNQGFYNQQTLNHTQGILRNNAQFNSRNNAAQPVDRNFVAQVVDVNNNPLPFANISVKNEGLDTYADAKGNVRLVSTDSLIPIEVKSLGFESQTFVLRSSDKPVTLRLTEDNKSNYDKESVAKKKSQGQVVSRRAFLQRDVSQDAEPADGWDKYDTYISNNLVIPDDLVKQNIHGEVAVSFEVQSNGRITNIKVDKSLCNDCDEIAKRIVEQGPQWKVKKGKKAKARITVQF